MLTISGISVFAKVWRDNFARKFAALNYHCPSKLSANIKLGCKCGQQWQTQQPTLYYQYMESSFCKKENLVRWFTEFGHTCPYAFFENIRLGC